MQGNDAGKNIDGRDRTIHDDAQNNPVWYTAADDGQSGRYKLRRGPTQVGVRRPR